MHTNVQPGSCETTPYSDKSGKGSQVKNNTHNMSTDVQVVVVVVVKSSCKTFVTTNFDSILSHFRKKNSHFNFWKRHPINILLVRKQTYLAVVIVKSCVNTLNLLFLYRASVVVGHSIVVCLHAWNYCIVTVQLFRVMTNKMGLVFLGFRLVGKTKSEL